MLDELLREARTVAIGGHVRPDGDCVGSCMGMYLYIRENYADRETDVYLEEIPEPFKFIEGTGDIRHEIPEGKTYDLFICLDCGDKDRLAFSAPLFDSARHTFCVDHHVSNESFAEKNYIFPDASSTSELVYNLIGKDRIGRAAAEALYLGIVHDTGVFQYSCTHPSTFMAAAELLKKGVDAPELIRDTYYVKTYAQNQILGRALLGSELLFDGRVIASHIRRQEMEHYGVTPKEMDGIVSHMRNTKGVKAAVFMYELEDEIYKVSLRSDRDIDVSAVAKYFGGGGHERAAGLTMTGRYEDVIARLSEKLEEQLGNAV